MTDLPMLARPSTGAGGRLPIDVRALVATGDWALDTKLDGIRAYWRDGRLINRKGVDITVSFPEVVEGLAGVEAWLDGEIIALDGRFETVGTRDKTLNAAKIAIRRVSMPCKFVAFDLPAIANQPWTERRAVLETLGVATTPVAYDALIIDHIADLGLEGVIAKRMTAKYQFGKRSPDWIKHKLTQRISVLIAGYEPGTGARVHFGAMNMAVLDEKGEPVSVGSVGTGFTEKQTWSLKAAIDAGELLIAEVECLSLTSGHTLRFPVFRGLRTDINPQDCTTEQLDVLPRS